MGSFPAVGSAVRWSEQIISAQQGQGSVDRGPVNPGALPLGQGQQGGYVHKSVLLIQDVHQDGSLGRESNAASAKLLQ
jgi:hypothetical protein